MLRSRTSAMLASAALGLAVLAGCSSDGNEDSTCKDLQALTADIRTLADVDLSGGSEALSDDLDQVDQAWQQAQETAGDQFGGELEALETSVQSLSTTVSDLGDGGASETVSALRDDITAVSEASSALADAVDSELSGCELSAN